jgi:hypothetical protein
MASASASRGSCLNEVQALIAAGRAQVRPIDQAIDLHAIAGFIDAPWLARLCETIITQHTTVQRMCVGLLI